MLPEPLHPAVVHFPIVFAVLFPPFAVGALIAIRRGASPIRAWALPLVLAVALAGSSWAAVETGEAQEERVEDVVGDAPMHGHEEAAERFLLLAGLAALVAGAGLIPGVVGASARSLTALGAFGLVLAGAQVGRTGGELVYSHGAASAYAAGAAGDRVAAPDAAATARERGERGERDDD